jgi:tRNA 5-methylaminomethyl-2-thiouridine biosynthesis bifunctional protein
MHITPANIQWKGDSPFSEQHQDIYFNPDQGLQESLYVFLNSNGLDKQLRHEHHPFDLSIGETGFGTGLNFLTTAQAWIDSQQRGQLTFISVEKTPLQRQALLKALNRFSDTLSLIDELGTQYPLKYSGFHQLSFLSGKIRLLLMLGDAAEQYSKLNANIDAWYLDGFAPSKNPDMWSPELFEQIGRLSKPGTTFSTFTAAGKVRRGLKAVGFDVRKQKGFGRKREMLVGEFIGEDKPKPSPKPWFNLPQKPKPDSVVVIGGGLAGCSTAYTLAKRGIQVTLIEKEAELATGGSGNPQGALYAKLPVKPTNQGALHITGLLHTLNILKLENPDQTFWQQSGVVQLATSEKEAQRQQSMIEGDFYPESLVCQKQKEELADIIGTQPQHSGLYFPEAGWVSPREFCQHLSQHENIKVINTELDSLEFINNHWTLHACNGDKITTSHVVVCAAEQTKNFEQTEHLPLKTIRGQVSIIDAPATVVTPKTVVCGEGYISPARDGKLCFGATFDLKGKERNITDQDHQENLSNLADIAPELAVTISQQQDKLTGRTAFRCSTPDYMPIVGPAPLYKNYLETFAQLRKDRKWDFGDAEPAHYPNLYVSTGHGSKGLITCPISAELIASMICNEPLPLPKDLIDMINPCRFIIKNLIKQAI